jgi:transposase-like protein
MLLARTRTKINVVCQNDACSYYHLETGKDIIKRGINRAGNRQYFCFHCNKYFVETKGTPLYNRKLSERKIKEVCKELVYKKGIRAVAETTHVDKNTVCTLLNDIAEHALAMTHYLVHDLSLSVYEVDELLTFIKKRKKHLNPTMIASLTQAKQQLRHV